MDTDDPNRTGEARLIPSYELGNGRIIRRGRLVEPEMYPSEPADMAHLQQRHGNDCIHLVVRDRWSVADLDAVATLADAEMSVFVEGAIDSEEAVGNLARAGAAALLLQPSFIASHQESIFDLEVGVFGLVESPLSSPTLAEEMRAIVVGGFEGVVTTETTSSGAQAARMLEFASMLPVREKPLVIARIPSSLSTVETMALIDAMRPLNVSKLVDGEFLFDMVRIANSEIVHTTIRSMDPED